ncbi:hypothetical protein ACQCVK_10600 [Rossellomorea vietnamensis]|uniref:hypothetical protein n=1 Tax=Rossellomorea vietnamensis TaxID=218284 RepID=UPI003CEACCF0
MHNEKIILDFDVNCKKEINHVTPVYIGYEDLINKRINKFTNLIKYQKDYTKLRNNVSINFWGYPKEDGKLEFEHRIVRQWVKVLFKEVPHLFYYLTNQFNNARMIFHCLAEINFVEISPDDEFKVYFLKDETSAIAKELYQKAIMFDKEKNQEYSNSLVENLCSSLSPFITNKSIEEVKGNTNINEYKVHMIDTIKPLNVYLEEIIPNNEYKGLIFCGDIINEEIYKEILLLTNSQVFVEATLINWSSYEAFTYSKNINSISQEIQVTNEDFDFYARKSNGKLGKEITSFVIKVLATNQSNLQKILKIKDIKSLLTFIGNLQVVSKPDFNQTTQDNLTCEDNDFGDFWDKLNETDELPF